jgi:mono/diheme cytochrome c family protein
MFLRRLLPVLAVLVAAAVGCGETDDDRADDQGEPPADTAGGDTTEGQAAAIDAHSQGHETFQQRCAACHGEDLRGTNGGPSLLSIVYEPNHHSDEAFRRAIEQGSPQHHWNFGDMPAMGQGLSDEVVDEVIAYIRVVQDVDGFES